MSSKAKFFIVNSEHKADYKLFFVDSNHKEKNAELVAPGELVKSEHQANVKIFIVTSEHKADIKVTRKKFPHAA